MDNNTNNDNNQKNDTAATSPLTSLTSSLLPHLPQQPTTTEETYATHRKQQLSLKSLKECQQTRRAKFLQEQKEVRLNWTDFRWLEILWANLNFFYYLAPWNDGHEGSEIIVVCWKGWYEE